jgi:hypothetical protein
MPQVARLYPGAGFGWRRKVTTHCVHGHAYTPENTLWREEGWRGCRECNRAAVRRYQARRANEA